METPKYYVYYKDKGKELVYTHFPTIEWARKAAEIVGGYIK